MILLAPESPAKFDAIKKLLQRLPRDLDGLKPHPDLGAYILQIARLALEGKEDEWEIVNEAFRTPGSLDVLRLWDYPTADEI